jgi:hypothetical protein
MISSNAFIERLQDSTAIQIVAPLAADTARTERRTRRKPQDNNNAVTENRPRLSAQRMLAQDRRRPIDSVY